mgnify:CR=1 FL=1
MKGKTIVTNRRDCSSYLWACLVQSGHFDVSTVKYTSSSYLPGGDATEAMEEAGFTWYPSSEITAEDLQAGDVLVRNGHVEIFSHFDKETNKEYAYTWGAVYKKEPAEKFHTKYNIWNR